MRKPLGLAVESLGIGIDAVGIGHRICRGGDGVPAVEEVGNFDERAVELVHDIGRVAIAEVGIEVERRRQRGSGNPRRRSRARPAPPLRPGWPGC